MLDISTHPMGLYGALTALGVFGIFIGTWWLYGMRTYHARRMLDSGDAILVDVDDSEEFAHAPVSGAHNIPLEELDDRLWELGSTRRTIVLCGTHAVRGYRAASRLRELGYHVMNLGNAFAAEHA